MAALSCRRENLDDWDVNFKLVCLSLLVQQDKAQNADALFLLFLLQTRYYQRSKRK